MDISEQAGARICCAAFLFHKFHEKDPPTLADFT
jgi:hypothetical protein